MQENVALGPLTTFKIGGPARFFVSVNNIEELREAYRFAKEKNLRTLILGGGSNVLIDDRGFEGAVIQISIGGIEEKEELVCAGAGVSWDDLVSRSIEKNLWGLENLSGIPGSVGGAVVGSIGAYGASVGETLHEVEVWNSVSERIEYMNASECEFGYRSSFFKHHPEYVVLRACFRLSTEARPNLSYKDIAAQATEHTSLSQIREIVLSIRAQKFPDLSCEGTAGSFFKNPILNELEAKKLQKQYPEMPVFTLPEAAGVKIPLAWLLDHVLKLKGTVKGAARLFEKQPLVIVASEGASSHDVEALAQMVKVQVKEKCNIEIEEEVNVISPTF